MSAQAANKAAKRNYAHQLKVRERKWMQERSTYQTEKVQFQEEVDLANIAAQRAYSRTQQQLNNAQALAIIQNQEDFKKMLQAEGQVEASAAERGVGGRSLARALVMNKGSYGVSQARRSRGLMMAGYAAKESNENVNRQLKQLSRVTVCSPRPRRVTSINMIVIQIRPAVTCSPCSPTNEKNAVRNALCCGPLPCSIR